MEEFPLAGPGSRRDLVPIRVYRLGAEPPDVDTAALPAATRVAMVWELSRRMWLLSGRPAPAIPRDQLPVRVLRRT